MIIKHTYVVFKVYDELGDVRHAVLVTCPCTFWAEVWVKYSLHTTLAVMVCYINCYGGCVADDGYNGLLFVVPVAVSHPCGLLIVALISGDGSNKVCHHFGVVVYNFYILRQLFDTIPLFENDGTIHINIAFVIRAKVINFCIVRGQGTSNMVAVCAVSVAQVILAVCLTLAASELFAQGCSRIVLDAV